MPAGGGAIEPTIKASWVIGMVNRERLIPHSIVAALIGAPSSTSAPGEPGENETAAAFANRMQATDPSFTLRDWLARHGADARRAHPSKRIWKEI